MSLDVGITLPDWLRHAPPDVQVREIMPILMRAFTDALKAGEIDRSAMNALNTVGGLARNIVFAQAQLMFPAAPMDAVEAVISPGFVTPVVMRVMLEIATAEHFPNVPDFPYSQEQMHAALLAEFGDMATQEGCDRLADEFIQAAHEAYPDEFGPDGSLLNPLPGMAPMTPMPKGRRSVRRPVAGNRRGRR